MTQWTNKNCFRATQKYAYSLLAKCHDGFIHCRTQDEFDALREFACK